MSERAIAPVLVLAVGNPSRGDDALGPTFASQITIELADELARGEMEVLTEFQLQIENTLDLAHRHRVVFVDAALRGNEPFSFEALSPQRDPSVSTHALSPGALLETFRGVFGAPPSSFVLAVRGAEFELGQELSPFARHNLERAIQFFVRWARHAA